MPIGLMSFDAVEFIGNLIQDNVTDINPSRSKEKWVFPQFPENDSNLPEVVVKFTNVNYDNDSAGNFLYAEYDEDKGVYREYFYKKATAIMSLVVITPKSDSLGNGYAVSHLGDQYKLKNSPLNMYLAEKIKGMLWSKRSNILELFDNFKIKNFDVAFDNNKWSWASIISTEVEYKDLFYNEIKDGDIVGTYTTNLIVQV